MIKNGGEKWPRVRVGDVLTLRNGRAFKSSEWRTSGTPIIRIQNLKSADAAFNYFDGELPDQFAARPGDLLFAWSGTPGTSFGAHVWNGPDAWVNQHIFRVDFPTEIFDRDFLCFALNQNVASYIDQAQGGVGLAHITKAKLNRSMLPAPPLAEQRYVAALLRDVDAHRESIADRLAAARATVERLRAAVLAAACSGRLTADWRAEHPELASSEERSGGLEGEASALPDTWAWSTVDGIAEVRGGIQVGAKTKATTQTRVVPYLRVANVQRGWLDLSEVKTIAAAEEKIAALRLQPGDIFFNEGGDRDKLGRGWVWEGQIEECIHQNHVFRARLHDQRFEPRFFSWYGNTFGPRYFFDEGKQTVNLASLSRKRLGLLPVPVPPPEEQVEIVARGTAALAVADRLNEAISTAAAATERAVRSALAMAFRGELTSTNGFASTFGSPRRSVGWSAHTRPE